MPPVIPRKRLQSDSPVPEQPLPKRTVRNVAPRRGRESVFQTLDTPPKLSKSLSQTEALLGHEDDDDSDDSDSSEDEFEDVITNGVSVSKGKGKQKAQDAESSAGEEWEDALGHTTKDKDEPVPFISGDIDLTLTSHPTQSVFAQSAGKKGTSKVQRHIRNITHCMHVQFLMFHNLIRNSWIQDKRVQKILVQNMSPGCWREVERYWRDSGISDGPKRVVQGGWTKKTTTELDTSTSWKDTGMNGVKEYSSPKGKGKAKAEPSKSTKAETPSSDRNQRDWGAGSDRLEPNTPNLSAGDPLLRLLRYLTSFWKSRFKISAPCLRKRGYLSPSTLESEIAAWREHPSDADTFGERIENIESFIELARRCEGSRDVGQQLFTALLRGLGIEARMVASLQPLGFGWSQTEEGKPKNLEKFKDKENMGGPDSSKLLSPANLTKRSQAAKGARVNVDDLAGDESSDLSSVISDSSDFDLVQSPVIKRAKNNYSDELPYPTYWTEAISHLTHTPVCVSPLPRSVIAPILASDALMDFYCRGAAADKAQQVFAYVIAFSSDGTAKDVTTRYLPKHQWPGKTKGFRVPVEKVPIYNKRGKVKKWEEWDWFKSVLRPYARDINKRKPWDEIEDEGDLVAKEPEKPKGIDEEGGRETLQGYKDSAEYVLEKHLRREEALKPGAKIVRYFKTGKGDKEKNEPVYYRKDIVTCKTVESWHKEGREVKTGEQPLKYVPTRAMTVARKREIEEREREEGTKVKQGLYSKAQTDWIIPDPIKDGKIPRNAFGNIDVYVPTMVPKGAVHIPLRGTGRICKKLGIDFAEACTGFEFGKMRAVPVLTGVVVATENEDLVIDAWEADQAEKEKKEQAKKDAVVLGMWKKFLVGLRIVDRMKKEYGDDAELPSTTVSDTTAAPKMSEWEVFQNHGEDFEGGFLRDEPGPSKKSASGFVRDDDTDMAGGFVLSSQEEHPRQSDDLMIDHGDGGGPNGVSDALGETGRQAPISLHSALEKPAEDLTDDEDDEDEGGGVVLPKSQPRARKRTQVTRNSRKKQTLPVRPKSRQQQSEDEDFPLSDLSASSPSEESEAEKATTAARKGKRKASTPPASTRTAPKRRAASKADAKVKSHHFPHDSDEETDLSPQKSSRGGRGRGGRGRGTGRKKAG